MLSSQYSFLWKTLDLTHCQFTQKYFDTPGC